MKEGIIVSALLAVVLAGVTTYIWRSKDRYIPSKEHTDIVAEPIPKVFENVDPALGRPRGGLSAEKLAAFERGRAQFMQRYDVEHGLGPLYNAVSCVACHDVPTVGGMGDLQHRIVKGNSPGEIQDIENFQSFATPGFKVPERPTRTSFLMPPQLWGMGDLEAIPDEFLRSAGCSGDGTLQELDGRVARFGTKIFAATIRGFVASALNDEMGITNETEVDRPLSDRDADAVPDPELHKDGVDDLIAFIANLAPPPTLPADPHGEELFKTFGCVSCHRPETGPGVRAFSDLCMHSMGEALADGIVSHNAHRVPASAPPYDGDEFRTKPLWGLRFRPYLLHDGRARTPDEAIRLHGGEAAGAHARYQSATQAERDALLAYLNTL